MPQPKPRRRMLVFLLGLELVHFLLPLNWGDDRIFFTKAQTTALLPFLRSSSRLLIDSLTYAFALHPWLWRLLNPLVLLGLCIMLQRLLQPAGRAAKGLLWAGAILPAMALVDAGFMATTLNYLWPFTAGLFVFYTITALPGAKHPLLRCAAAAAALCYACAMQQVAAVLLCVLLLQTLCYARKKARLQAWVSAALALLAMACTALLLYRSFFGANPRFARESARYFPGFAALSLPQKLELGFSSTLHGLSALSLPTLAFFAFCIWLSAATFRRSPARPWRVLSLLPPVGLLGLFLLQTFGQGSALAALLGPLVNTKMNRAVYRFSPGMDAIYLLLAAVVVLLLLRLQPLAAGKWKLLLLGAFGLGTRVMMGFSPTVWASGYRTYYFLLMALLAIVYISPNRLWRNPEGSAEVAA